MAKTKLNLEDLLQSLNTKTKTKKQCELKFEDLLQSFNTKAEHMKKISEFIKQLPCQDLMTCKSGNMDNPTKNLVITCIYKIPFKMRESQFMAWNDHDVLNVIPAQIAQDSYTHFSVKFDVNKQQQVRFKLDWMSQYVYRKTKEDDHEYIEAARMHKVHETSVYDIIYDVFDGDANSKAHPKRMTDNYEWFKEAVEACIKAFQTDCLKDAYHARNVCIDGKALTTLK